jgi:two-component system phosphate regulon sensor histidine kinase PhoR
MNKITAKKLMKQLLALSQTSQAVTASLNLDRVLNKIILLAGKAVGSDYATVILINKKGKSTRSAENISGMPAIEYRKRKKGFTNWIMQAGKPLIADTINKNGSVSFNLNKSAPCSINPPLVKAGIKSLAGLPLKGKKRVLGVLFLHSLKPNTFSNQLALLTAFANHAAIAVENARLYEALKKNQEKLKAYSKSLEKTVEQRTEKLSQLVESQKEFIAHVGHELRTPLSVIKAVAETELDNNYPHMKKQLTLIDKKVELMSWILRDLMLVSRLEIEQKSFRKTRFSLRILFKEALADVLREARLNNITPKTKINCSKKIKLYCDRTKMFEVLINLLRNAVIHSSGKPQIDLKVKMADRHLQILVEDNNHYIPKKDFKKIFERFYQTKRAKGKANGLGLGLYIAQKLVELMGGKIWIKRKKTKGNCFIIQLPTS